MAGFNAHNARLFSVEVGNSRLFHRLSIDTARLSFPASLPLWPAHLNHAELSRNQGFTHYNCTRFAVEMPLEGNLIGECRGQTHIVSPGEVYLIHYGEDSSYRVGPAGFCRKVGICFSGPLLPALVAETGLVEELRLKLRDPERFYGYVVELERRICEATQEEVADLSSFSYRLLLELAASIDRELPPLLRQAIDVMKVNLSQMITIGEIAEKLQTSTSTLENLFARHRHTSPRKYFDDLKFAKAEQLLAESSLPLGQIAHNIGYPCTMHFSRRFRQRTGMTPTEFRRKRQKASPQSV